MKARELAGIATMVALATSAFLFYVYYGPYPSLTVFTTLIVVIMINIRNWKRR